jgi:pimeloyl-ACP methyl ester carboxylesterase
MDRPSTGRFAQANGLRMYYEESGAGEPLILLHGGTDTGRYWDPILPYLANRYRIIAPDSRGHGRTDNPSGSLTYPQMAADVVALIPALGLEKPVVGGWSDGGQIALEIGIRYPNVARALVVGGAGYRFSPEYVLQVRLATFAHDDGTVDLAVWETANPEAIPPLREVHQHVYGPEHWQAVLQWCAQLWLTPFGLTASDFAKIAAPTLLVNGDRDQFFPVEEEVELLRMIKPAELAIFPGADHSLPTTRPEAFASVIVAFLDRH